MTNGQTQGDQGAAGAQGHPDAGWSLWRPTAGRWSELDPQFYYAAAVPGGAETRFYVGGLMPYQGYDRRADTPGGGGWSVGSERERATLAAGRMVGFLTDGDDRAIVDTGIRYDEQRYAAAPGAEPVPADRTDNPERTRTARAEYARIQFAGWFRGGGIPIMLSAGHPGLLVGGWRDSRITELLRAAGELGSDAPLPNRIPPPGLFAEQRTAPVFGVDVFTLAAATAAAGIQLPAE